MVSDAVIQIGQKPRRRWRQNVVGVVLAVILLFVFVYAPLITDFQWFKELGRDDVFLQLLSVKARLFIGVMALFLIVAGVNIRLAFHLNRDRPRPIIADRNQEMFGKIAVRGTAVMSAVVTVLVALGAGLTAAGHWDEYLQFTHGVAFGVTDPIFGNDVSYYIFRLPFFRFLQSSLLFALVLTTVGAGAIHALLVGSSYTPGRAIQWPVSMTRHLLVLLGSVAIVWAWGIYLGRYEVLTHNSGVFFGAGYTDVHFRIPAAGTSAFLLLLTGLSCFAGLRAAKPFALPAGMAAVWLLVSGIYGVAVPAFVQNISVVPNQFGKEQAYIDHDIRLTRQAYGLDKIVEKELRGTTEVTSDAIRDDDNTLKNVRLWDWPQLGAVYNNRQAVRPYYKFTLPFAGSDRNSEYNIDVDRYTINGERRQVMVGPREFFSEGLPKDARTWQNQRLQYTHGYGVVASPVNKVDAQGLPEFFVGEIPVKPRNTEFAVTRPEIYFGEMTDDYVFVNTAAKEFDYPADDGNRENRYQGKGGVPVGGELSKLAWSVRLGDTNMLLSGDLSAESRVMFRRNIRERVSAIAPFLTWDRDPYMVVTEGRMVWIMDGFTTSSEYPYSKPSRLTGSDGGAYLANYVRNSIKAVVDAYDGTVNFYIVDENEPIARTWSRIFPGLFKPLKEMPEALRAHLRYPEDLFKIQRDIYTLYHIREARTYYGKEDAWDVPIDPTASPDSTRQGEKMAPYYVVMRLPGEKQEEFLLMTPFSPRSKDNMSAWMCAKCDPEDYGQLLVYRFPKGSNVNGPRQFMALARRDKQISEFMTLLGQRGSQVIFGNLLAVPIGTGLLYVMPVYVQSAEANSLPGISQVIVGSGDRVSMQPTLEKGLAALFGAPLPPDTASPTTPEGPKPNVAVVPGGKPAPTVVALPIDRLSAAYDRARAKQKEYNDALDELGRAIKEIRGSAGKR